MGTTKNYKQKISVGDDSIMVSPAVLEENGLNLDMYFRLSFEIFPNEALTLSPSESKKNAFKFYRNGNRGGKMTVPPEFVPDKYMNVLRGRSINYPFEVLPGGAILIMFNNQ